MNKSPLIVVLLLMVILAGCNLPGSGQITQSPDAIYTQAAQTVAAELTRVAQNVSPTPEVPTNTTEPSHTNTPNYTPTYTSIPCNIAAFISDVTYPDNTVVNASQNFQKIWRLKNIGTCTWTSSYKVTFEGNAGMGKAAGYSQSLGATVPPNQTVDIVVDLTAPAASGTYQGNWAIRDPDNKLFPNSSFIIIIQVANSHTVTLSPLPGESGTIRSDAGPWPDFTAGESNSDITKTAQFFLSYDITGIPLDATITEVKFDLRDYSTTGNPFGSLGEMRTYTTDYGLTLEPADFVAGFPGGNIANWTSTGDLNAQYASVPLKTYLQSKIGSGRLQLRMQFAASNMDATKDRITFANPTLVVTYSRP
jgi:hypothetical protein